LTFIYNSIRNYLYIYIVFSAFEGRKDLKRFKGVGILVKYDNNIHLYIKDIKKELTEEIKDAGLKTGDEIEIYISNYAEDVLTYYDYLRDIELIAYAEQNLDFFDLNDFVDDAIISIWFKEGIYSFINKIAKVCLTEILLFDYDLDEVE
jgi:hypothetical protein